MRTMVRVLRYAVLAGFQDYSVTFTWKTWLAGWYVRVLFQVVFFALIGRLLGSEGQLQFLLVGNAVMLAAIGSLFAVAGTTWERRAGTLPLLVAAPSSPLVVFAGRSAWALTDGFVSSVAAFFVAAPLFGLDLPWPRTLLVVPLTALVAASSYALGMFLGGLVLRAMSMRNVTANLTWGTIMAIGGVNVPVDYYPAPVQWLAQMLPLTHGLQAIRELLAGESFRSLIPDAGLEVLVGLGWLTLALITFNRLAEGGRRDGSIEFGG
jgi:ABC-2 type transport system permease protein